MADGCRLPKVIVVLLLVLHLALLSCATQRYDDLLERIRVSKSNDPEIRDFLKSVLKHHSDFRWISHEATKFSHDPNRNEHENSEDHLLPLSGISQKNKRSFYSKNYDSNYETSDENNKPVRYVYRHDPNTFDDFDDFDDHSNEEDVQSFASDTNNDHPEIGNVYKKLTPKITKENLEFDGPVNDIYPYQEDHDLNEINNIPQQDKRFVRETQDTFLYDDNNLQQFDDDDDKFFEDQQNLDAESEDNKNINHDRSKRSASTEALLNEKMLLHKVLHQGQLTPERFNRNGIMSENFRRTKNHEFHPLAFHMPGDAIEVIPNSQKGVHYAPGTKFERYGSEFLKSEQDLYNQEDLNDLEAQYNADKSRKLKFAKRKCADTLAESDFKVPELFDGNKSQLSDVDQPLSEFYYSLPHDVIGLNQDLIGENREVNNVSCKKFRRDVSDFLENNKKSIKIKIFDDQNLVQDIQEGKGNDQNSVILSIRDNKPGTNQEKEKDQKNDLDPDLSSNLDSYIESNSRESIPKTKLTEKVNRKTSDDSIKISDDADTASTLQKIDRIIKHDQATLKLHNKFSEAMRSIPEDLQPEEDNSHVNSWNKNSMNELGGSKANLRSHHKKFNRINELEAADTYPDPYQKYQETNRYSDYFKPQTCYKHKNIEHYPIDSENAENDPRNKVYDEVNDGVNKYQNHLEDQTEPTSAAEQRELGKSNNFNTESMNMKTTSEKVIIIPFKKSNKLKNSIDENHDLENVEDFKVVVASVKTSNNNNINKIDVNKLEKENEEFIKNEDKRSHSQIDEDDKEKNLNLEDEVEQPQKVNKNLNQRKADAFRSRKLFDYEYDSGLETENLKVEKSSENDQVSELDTSNLDDSNENFEDRKKKDIRTSLGMRNDQDYSEDKIDFFGDDQKSKAKAEKKLRSKTVESKKREDAKIRQKLLGSIINSQQERRALKVKVAKTKGAKIKKDANELDLTATNAKIEENIDQNPSSFEEIENKNREDRDIKKPLKTEDTEDKEEKENKDANQKVSKKQRFDLDLNDIDSSPVQKDKAKSIILNTKKDNTDRCCDNTNADKEKEKPCESEKLNKINDNPSKQFSSNGNELDIIEKTQAILLHITGPPENQNNQYQTDDSGSCKNDRDQPNLTIKRLNSFKVINPEGNDEGIQEIENKQKNPENVVSEIIKLVQNYKDKVNEYNKNNRHTQNAKSSTEESVNKVEQITKNHQEEKLLVDDKEIKTLPEHSTEFKSTTKDYIEDIIASKDSDTSDKILEDNFSKESDKILSSDDEESAGFHAHAMIKAKKLHPIKTNKCEVKPANDRGQDFVVPLAVREGYSKPEVVADSVSKSLDNINSNSDDFEIASDSDVGHNAEKRSENMDNFKTQDAKDIFENEKNTKKRHTYLSEEPNKILNEENPLSFTPDSVDSFKEIVETDKSEDFKNSPSAFEGQGIAKREDLDQLHKNNDLNLDNENFNPHHQVYKRDLDMTDDNKDYSDDEIDKLLDMVDLAEESSDLNKNVKSDQELLKRYRRYKNFEPYIYESSRYRHSDGNNDQGFGFVTTTTGQTTVVTTILPQCAEVENKPTLERGEPFDDDRKKKKKRLRSHGHNHKCTFDEEGDEYGAMCKPQGAKKSKSQINEENRLKEKTRDKIYEDKLTDKQKEQQHIKNVLNGHIVLEIMDKFHTKMKENERLHSRFGPAARKCAEEEVELIDKFKEEQSRSDIRHAQLMLHQVIVLMNKIVADQVHRRTCLILSPTLKAYLKKTAGNRDKQSKPTAIAEGYPLPAVKDSKGSKDRLLDDAQGDFLFPQAETEEADNPTPLEAAIQMKKKINMIKALLAKYNHMSRACQIHVQPVHDYLVHHLKTLETMYKNKQYGTMSDSCDVACVNDSSDASKGPQGDKVQRSTISAASISSGSGGNTGETATTPGSTVASTVSVGSPEGSASVTGGVGGAGEAGKAKAARRATFEPLHFKEMNQNRIFRHYDDGYSNIDVDSDSGKYPTEEYRRLVEAADNYRRKRQIEERLARLFGKSRTKKVDDATTHKMDDDVDADISNVAFEAPMVYSLHK